MLPTIVASAQDAFIVLRQHVPPELIHSIERHWNHAQSVAQPVVERVVQATIDASQPAIDRAWPSFERAIDAVDSQLHAYEPYQVVALTAASTILLLILLRAVLSLAAALNTKSLVQTVCTFARQLPGLRGKVAKMRAQAARDVSDKLSRTDTILRSLPRAGQLPGAVLQKLKHFQSRDILVADGRSSLSGTVYIGSEEHKRLLDEAYAMFSGTNPLHSDAFPSVRQMEAEVVAMTASILGGCEGGDPEVCGAMTSGGSESILIAMKASRDYMRATRGITKPEMIIATSAHAAYFKAAEYFHFKLVRLPVDAHFRLNARSVARAMTSNTAVVVASAPGFPHGVIDCIEDIAALTRRRGVCLHVDACLGGFVLPFARQLGRAVPPFDFSVPGVTSMSVDTHKYGMAHKGSSVVLYRSPEYRRHQYTAITDWSGGLYISPGMAGSRSGGLIAAAWASLVRLGHEGLLEAAGSCLEAAETLQAFVEARPELKLVGRPDMCVVAFTTADKRLDVFVLNDLMTQRGWHLNALQFPAALHFCFTAQHGQVVDDLLRDLRECVTALKAQGGPVKGGSAPMYGTAATLPDRELIGDLLVDFQDVLLRP